MLSLQGTTWVKVKDSEELSSTTNNNNNDNIILESKGGMDSFSSFKSMLEMEGGSGCYVTTNSTNTNIQTHHHLHHQDGLKELDFPSNLGDPDGLLLHQVDSTSSCSPNSSVFHNLGEPSNSQVHHFFMQPNKQLNLASLLNVVPTNPLENGFDIGEFGFIDNQVGGGGGEGGELGVGMGVEGATTTMGGSNLLGKGCELLGNFIDLSSNNQMGSPGLCSDPQFSVTQMFQLPGNGPGFGGFRGFDESSGGIPFLNRSKLLRPLESFPSLGAQPTLFQKRAASRKNLANNGRSSGALSGDLGKRELTHLSEDKEKKRKWDNQDDLLDDVSIDCSGLNYDSDNFTENQKMEEVGKNGGNGLNANSTVTGGGGDQKGKKKGLPAKNLMAERRRRKKLNDRLYMLRSVVPKISKMDRASILGDAIEYLKELLQRINDLHNELESTPPGSSSTPTTSFHPLTPTPSALPSRIMDKLCPSSLPSPNGQPARVEVRPREGRAVNIHLFCSRKPGLLLSTMRALDNLGLDVQQAVISCFNGFAMDIFRAEQCQEGQEIPPDQIKAVLLETVGFHGLL